MVLQLVLVWGGAVVLSWYWSGEERVVLQLVVWGGAHGTAADGLGRSTWCCSWVQRRAPLLCYIILGCYLSL